MHPKITIPKKYPPYQMGIWFAEYLNPTCRLCYVNLAHSLLCIECHQSIAWHPKAFAIDLDLPLSSAHHQRILMIQPASLYQYPLSQAIVGFKHAKEMSKLPILIHALRQLSPPNDPNGVPLNAQNSLIVPMPTTQKRLAKRGYDVVAILADYLAKHWQIPIWKGISRIDDTVSQQKLNRHQRQENVKNAFAVLAKPPAKNLILFDDVATTGASLKSLATTFYQAYPDLAITSVCLAHGDLRR